MAAFIFADKPPNRGASVGLLKKTWANMGEVRVSTKSDTTFAITVSDQSTADKIIEGGPLNVAGYCCSVQSWSKDLALEEIPFHLVAYWVQLHGLPLGQYSVKNAKIIGEAYGEVLQVEDPSQCPEGIRGFLRIRLQLDDRKPIPTGFWLARDEGKPSKVEFYYETQRLPIICYSCGRVGHNSNVCRFGSDPQPATGNRYGSWIFVDPVRLSRVQMTNSTGPQINLDEGSRRWTAGSRGEPLHLTAFSFGQGQTFGVPQNGGGSITSLPT